MPLAEAGERLARRIRNPWSFTLYLWWKLPLAACAGLSLERLDGERCVVRLPGGWRTQNPFRSTYFAAQAMAAEMSTGAPAMVLTRTAPASVAMLVRGIKGDFERRIQGVSRYTFGEVAEMQAVVARAAATDEPQTYTARSVVTGPDGQACSQFEVLWSFKRRASR